MLNEFISVAALLGTLHSRGISIFPLEHIVLYFCYLLLGNPIFFYLHGSRLFSNYYPLWERYNIFGFFILLLLLPWSFEWALLCLWTAIIFVTSIFQS